MSNILNDDLAFSVWKTKYAAPGEEHPDDMHARLAKEVARIEDKYISQENSWLNFFKGTTSKLSLYGKIRNPLTYDRLMMLFMDFKYVVPQGSIMSMLGRKDVIGSLSNCFVVGQPEDSYGGILYKDQQLAQLMKRRGGVGIDISTLRPAGAKVTNAAGSSTGAASFMERFSNTTREVAQNGRRGALMITIDCRHPDVFEFVNIKQDRTKVTGANISVNLRDDFMQAVIKNGDYILRWPCEEPVADLGEELPYNELINKNGVFYKKIRAKELYDQIVHNAWDNAEPGQMFIDRQWNYSPDSVYPQYKGVTTNPCGEIFMQPYDACRLLAINLTSFVKNPYANNAAVDWNKLYEVAYEQQRIADDIVDLEIEHIDRIILKLQRDPESMGVKRNEINLWTTIREVAASGRRTGCGFTGLGDMLAMLGLPYDSDEAKDIIDKVMSTKLEGELDCTIDLAILRGPFKGNNPEIENNLFYDMLNEKFSLEAARMKKYGRRNVSWSTVAPTGTVSLMTQTTSGLEPLFQPYYTRRRKINPNDPVVRIDFVDQNGDKWMEYPVFHPEFKNWLYKSYRNIDPDNLSREELDAYFKMSPWYGSCANDINWLARVEIQGIIQKYTTHSISSTINLPNDVTEQKVSQIYIESWINGLKGVTIYRDGCRTGVLVTEPKQEDFAQHNAPKRPESLDADLHAVKSSGKNYNVIVGLMNGKPYEVFAIPAIAKKNSKGTVVKQKKGSYNFVSEDGKSFDSVTSTMSQDEAVVSRLISTSLRHGADIKFVVEQLNKSEGPITSFARVIARVLKSYIPDGEQSTVQCYECGSSNVIYEEGCNKCLDCGSSKCG